MLTEARPKGIGAVIVLKEISANIQRNFIEISKKIYPDRSVDNLCRNMCYPLQLNYYGTRQYKRFSSQNRELRLEISVKILDIFGITLQLVVRQIESSEGGK